MLRIIRRCAVALAVLALAGEAGAQAYAVMSVVGSQMSVVHYQPRTPGRTDANAHQAYELRDRALDDFATRAAEAVVRKRHPDANVLRLSADDAAWLAGVRTSAIEADGKLDALLEPVVAAARRAGATRLLLIVPARTDLRLELAQQSTGSGRAAGLGLYVDPMLSVQRADTGESARGLLGVFANFRLSVIDVGSGRHVGDETITSGRAYSAARAADANILNALSAEQKVDALRSLLAAGIERELPALIERTGR